MNIISLFKVPFLLITIIISSLSYAETAWIDVRSLEEHTADNIAGDVRITHTEIVDQIKTLYPDKNTDIHLYCRSGNRAGKAMSALKEAGYTNISNAGGINDARKVRELDESSKKCC